MKVAIIGAPGVGKTKIARRIARRLNQESKDWTVIDGYVDKLRDRTGWSFGADSNMRSNLQVIAERWTLEDEAAKKGKHTITCGSVYESVIYSSVETMGIQYIEDERQMLDAMEIARVWMGLLGVLEQRFFDYDALFFLGFEEKQDELDWNGVIDAKLPEVLEGFFRYAVGLEGTDKQKVDHATDIIREIYTKVYQDQGEGVQPTPSDSEGQAD